MKSLFGDCFLCGNHKKVRSPKMKYSGEGRKEILIMGEAPGEEEDQQGRQFVGASGKLLRAVLRECGYEPDRDFWFFNSVNCRTMNERGGNRTPTDKEIGHCFHKVRDTVLFLQPKIIFSLGSIPLKIFLNNYLSSKKSISEVRGTPLVNGDFGCWVLPSFHPSYVLRNPDEKELRNIFIRDIASLKSLSRKELEERLKINRGFTYEYKNRKKVNEFLIDVSFNRKTTVSIDFETTNLSPYR